MSVRIVFPKLKLAAQLRTPGGLPVEEALAAAEASLAEIRPQCLSELQALVVDAEACFEHFRTEYNADLLTSLYAIAVRGVGAGSVCGAPAADSALISLCDLLDRLRAAGRWDRDAVAVHVRTLQLLVHAAGQNLDPAAASKILEGLHKVSARYAPAEPAAD